MHKLHGPLQPSTPRHQNSSGPRSRVFSFLPVELQLGDRQERLRRIGQHRDALRRQERGDSPPPRRVGPVTGCRPALIEMMRASRFLFQPTAQAQLREQVRRRGLPAGDSNSMRQASFSQTAIRRWGTPLLPSSRGRRTRPRRGPRTRPPPSRSRGVLARTG